MTISLRTTLLIILSLALLAGLTAGCGTTEDPAGANHQPGDNNHQDTNHQKADAGKQNQDTSESPSNPYEKLGLPYTLYETPPGTTAPWPGKITHGALIKIEDIIDGDTVRNPLPDQKNIRLLGMDAPECAKHKVSTGIECDPNNKDYTYVPDSDIINEPFGAESAQALKDLIALNPEVRIACEMAASTCKRDMYDRFLAWIVVDTPDGPVDASRYLIEQGLAWPYTSFPTENMADYCTAEDEAIAAKRGMWKDGFEKAYAAMHPDTRKWYQYRNTKCRELQKNK